VDSKSTGFQFDATNAKALFSHISSERHLFEIKYEENIQKHELKCIKGI